MPVFSSGPDWCAHKKMYGLDQINKIFRTLHSSRQCLFEIHLNQIERGQGLAQESVDKDRAKQSKTEWYRMISNDIE